MNSLYELSSVCKYHLELQFKSYLQRIPETPLKDAIQYVIANSGKQIRPLLVFATGSILKANVNDMIPPALAIELIHMYSLIHDDLPCMDDADLRRSKPTCHKVFGEGMAVLTGDALQSMAFDIIINHPSELPYLKRLKMLNALISACGPAGMISGQALDITENEYDIDTLLEMYALKTGALIKSAVVLGHLCGEVVDPLTETKLDIFARALGLAFQIQDDILDIECSTEKLGKQKNTDQKNCKITYPSLVGLKNAKQKIQELYGIAMKALDHFEGKAKILTELTEDMLVRQK